MAIPWAPVPEGTRVRIRQQPEFPQDPAILGRTGLVVSASEYQTQSVGVILDGGTEVRYFAPGELEAISDPVLASPDKEAARQRRSLP